MKALLATPATASRALAVARRRVLEYGREHPELLCAFVAGSTAQGGGCAFGDVDLRVVMDGHERFSSRKGAYELVEGVLLDWSFQHRSEYEDVDALLRDSALAPNVFEAVVLHDPRGFLPPLQQRVRARYAEPDGLRARVSARLVAFAHHAREAERHARAGSVFGLAAAVLALPKYAASAPTLLTCRPPTGRRRLFVVREALHELGRADLFAAFEAFYEAGRVQAEAVQRGLTEVMRLYDRANAVAQVALDRHAELRGVRGVIDPLKREYWSQGILEMLSRGHVVESLSPLVHVGTIAAVILAASELPGSSLVETAKDAELLRRLGFLGTRTLAAKARGLEPYRHELVRLAEERLGALPDEARA